MARAKIKMYPYAVVKLGEQGVESVHYNAYSWRSDAGYSKESNSVTIPFPPIEAEIEVPDDLRPQCLEILGKFRQDIKAQHQLTLTQLQFAENSLLGLAAPEVLDKGDGPPAKDIMQQFGDDNHHDDDDIPF